MSIERPPTLTEDRLPAWRRACFAFRECRQAGPATRKRMRRAVAAVQSVLLLAWKEASAEAVNAVAYATRYHPEWFWPGAQHSEKWRAKLRDNLNRRTPRH